MARAGNRLWRAVRRRLFAALTLPELTQEQGSIGAELDARDARLLAQLRDARSREHVIFGDPARVTIGNATQLNDALLNVASGTIVIADTAFFGHGVRLLTGTHDIERLGVDRQQAVPREGRDIVIGAGAWVASGATVIGPCVIGADAVVAAGAVVAQDVPPGVVVAGIPARPTGRTVAGQPHAEPRPG